MSIAENIRTIRKESGMSQAEVGARLGITGSMINQIERGTKTPSLALSKELADIFGCKVEDFLK